MRRREKPAPVLKEGERPPCAFLWQVDPDDGHRFSAGCACRLPYSEHPRYREAMRQAIAPDRIPPRERMRPLRAGVLRDKGQRRRYLLDGEATDVDYPGGAGSTRSQSTSVR